ncbi:hypothetical protein ACRCRN_29145 [Pseudomonas aeruginosa]
MTKERFEIRKSESIKKPWLVEDTHSNRAEDPVIYLFSSKKKAEAFKAMLMAEQSC